MQSGARRSMAVLALLATMVVSVAGFSATARANEHNPQESGHVLRVTAYALHPIGVILDTLIFRPAHWIAHREPMTTLFGHYDHW